MKYTSSQVGAFGSPFPGSEAKARSVSLRRRNKWFRNLELVLIVCLGLFGLLVVSLVMLVK